MKIGTLIHCVVADVIAIVFQGHQKFNYLFLCFWLCLLLCRLLWSCLGELVSVMERDPCCSIEKLYGECESWFLEKINAKLSTGWRELDKR
jgi:hypothetical protein